MLIGSVLQGIALFLHLLFDGLVSLYIISALFGLFQGGIVPMYAIIVRVFLAKGIGHPHRYRADVSLSLCVPVYQDGTNTALSRAAFKAPTVL